MITVVVPVFDNIKITDDFFETICKNTVIPSEVILIDNGSSDKYYKLVKKYKHQLSINYIRNEKNEGVNSAWNEGIKLSDTPFISILNNDLLLNKYFFQKVLEAMDNSEVGIVVPTIVKSKKTFEKSFDNPVVLKELRRKMGCAFTIRKSITNKLHPIPGNLKTYCGDDYLFYYSRFLGYKNFKIINNSIFHYGGATVWKVWPDGKTTRAKEKVFWKKIKGVKNENIIA